MYRTLLFVAVLQATRPFRDIDASQIAIVTSKPPSGCSSTGVQITVSHPNATVRPTRLLAHDARQTVVINYETANSTDPNAEWIPNKNLISVLFRRNLVFKALPDGRSFQLNFDNLDASHRGMYKVELRGKSGHDNVKGYFHLGHFFEDELHPKVYVGEEYVPFPMVDKVIRTEIKSETSLEVLTSVHLTAAVITIQIDNDTLMCTNTTRCTVRLIRLASCQHIGTVPFFYNVTYMNDCAGVQSDSAKLEIFAVVPFQTPGFSRTESSCLGWIIATILGFVIAVIVVAVAIIHSRRLSCSSCMRIKRNRTPQNVFSVEISGSDGQVRASPPGGDMPGPSSGHTYHRNSKASQSSSSISSPHQNEELNRDISTSTTTDTGDRDNADMTHSSKEIVQSSDDEKEYFESRVKKRASKFGSLKRTSRNDTTDPQASPSTNDTTITSCDLQIKIETSTGEEQSPSQRRKQYDDQEKYQESDDNYAPASNTPFLYGAKHEKKSQGENDELQLLLPSKQEGHFDLHQGEYDEFENTSDESCTQNVKKSKDTHETNVSGNDSPMGTVELRRKPKVPPKPVL